MKRKIEERQTNCEVKGKKKIFAKEKTEREH